MPASSYASVSDLVGASGYLRDPNPNINSAIMNTLLAVSSRFIDEVCGQFFYDDGQYTRYFDGLGISHITTEDNPFFGSSGTIAAVSQGGTTLTYTTSPLAPRVPAVNDILMKPIVRELRHCFHTGAGPRLRACWCRAKGRASPRPCSD